MEGSFRFLRRVWAFGSALQAMAPTSTDVGDFDCLTTPAGTEGYADLSRDAVSVDLDGVEVLVASLDELIRMKRAAGRAKDRAELEIGLRQPVYGYLVLWEDGNLVIRIRRRPAIDGGHPLRGLTIAVDPGHPPIGALGL